jgi:hypothetical protein
MHRSKSERIKGALRNGDWVAALRLASRFHDRSPDTLVFKRGFDAYQHPRFYLQLQKDPDEIVATAVTLLHRQFGSPCSADEEVARRFCAHRKQVLF